MIEAPSAKREPVVETELDLVMTSVIAIVVGGALIACTLAGATPLLVAVAGVQALLGVSWVLGTQVPGRIGALFLAALAAGGADYAVSTWPHDKLGPLLGALGLAVPLMFVHQLTRGAARIHVVGSMAAVAVLIMAEIGPAALLQLRHEFGGGDLGGKVAAAVAAAIAGALLVGCLTDLVVPAPRFDPAIPRGLPAVVAATGLGAALGYLVLRDEADFIGGRSAFVGAALGALAGFTAVGTAFVLHSTGAVEGSAARWLRPFLSVVVPVAVVSPVAFLLCLAIRS